MAGKMGCEDEYEDMMYCAGILLELPQLVYLSEFKEAWKQGNWNSTKKRSARKIRRPIVDFNCWMSSIPRLGSSSSASECCVSCLPNNKSQRKRTGGNVAGKKRKRTNPNSNWGPAETIKPNPTPTTAITTTLLKVKFKLSPPSSHGHTEKDSSSSSSGVSSNLLKVGGGDDIMAGKKRKKKERADGDVAGKKRKRMKKTREAGLPPPAGHKNSNINYFEKTEQTDKPFIPDLNIPLTMTEDHHLPNPTKSTLLPAPRTAVPRPHCFTIHNYRASMDRAAAAKEKRMMRMMKLKQRKMAS